jgi:hypothetical protein
VLLKNLEVAGLRLLRILESFLELLRLVLIAHWVYANELCVCALLLSRKIFVLFGVLLICLGVQSKVKLGIVFAVCVVSKSVKRVGLLAFFMLDHYFWQVKCLLEACVLAPENLVLLRLLSKFVPLVDCRH